MISLLPLCLIHCRNINSMMRQQMRDMEAMMNGGFYGMDDIMAPNSSGGRYNNPRQQMIDDGTSRNVSSSRNRANDDAMIMNPFSASLFGGAGGFFGGSLMGDIFQQMESIKERAATDPNSVVYSQSTMISMAPSADGRMHTYESTDSMRKHGHVKETRSTLRDSSRGVEKMTIGHHIGQRGHVIEKQRVNGGNIEENQRFINVDRSKARQFDDEWTTATRNAVLGGREIYDDRERHHLPIDSHRYDAQGRHASPYARLKGRKKNRGPIIEEAD
uniref:Myeloid leukemia factor n=1 Tax=Romanomermis culicivorax TaxID=13658 RepID=A0A915L0A7_ROMCU